jgi:radical SAM-linked protein
MRTITRALIRSGIVLSYSQGYNPHPRFSLPLPKNVGLASDDELFCVKIQKPQEDKTPFVELISAQLPQGFELLDIEVYDKSVTYQPIEVEYRIKIESPDGQIKYFEDVQKLNEQIKQGRKILLERNLSSRGDVKTIDVAGFLKSFEVVGRDIKILCKILPSGTIRPDELLRLLNIEPLQISSSIIRKNVKWQIN